MQAAIAQFDKRIHKTFETGAAMGKLGQVKGNFSIIVHEVAQWTVIPDGPRAGVYRELTDDEMGFIMITTPEVFAAMNTPADPRAEAAIDHDQIIEEGKIAIHGDCAIYEQFIAMGAAQGMLAMRAASSAPKKRKAPRALF